MDYALAGLLVFASVYDLKYRRIPNWLIGLGLALAFMLNIWQGSWSAGLISIEGFLAGIALLIIPFSTRGIGAGDVKLLGLVGAFKGPLFVLNAFLWMAMWGGLMALVIAYRNGKLGQMIFNLMPGSVRYGIPIVSKLSGNSTGEKVVYPYALAIALGTLCAYLKGWF